MNEAVAGRPSAPVWRRSLGQESVGPIPAEPDWPLVGAQVGGFQLEARLGSGSFGTVYRARRGTHCYALKLLHLPSKGRWAWRELEVLQRLRRVGWLAVEGHGLWPDEAPRFLFIVMPLVRGLPLYDWARHRNPSARGVVELMRRLVQQVGQVHRAGVVHRDIKGTNVLVRPEGQPVLVDFGVGTYPDAPEVTSPIMPPGTPYYRSPEIIHFRRHLVGVERYRSRPGDDLWALGVLLYWLLTSHYPFEASDPGALASIILRASPRVPHERNPRVPRALSELCLRMLAREAEDRYPDAETLQEGLAALRAHMDMEWERPLGEEWAPDNATTPVEAQLELLDEYARVRRVREYEQRHPRRGVPEPTEDASVPPLPAAPVLEGDRPRGPWGRGEGALLAVGLLASGVLLSAVLWAREPAVRGSTPPVGLPLSTLEVMNGDQEVARPWCPLEGERGARPSWLTTPVPVARVTRQEIAHVKTLPLSSSARVGGVLLGCGLATGCPAPATQVRPVPPARSEPQGEACPAGALEAMESLGLREGDEAGGRFAGYISSEDFILIHSGPGTRIITFERLGPMPAGTVVTGHFVFGKERMYGRFTEAYSPDGKTWPVCLEVWQRGSLEGRGLVPWQGRRDTDTALVTSFPDLKVVKHFTE